jgi:hypothetical protein
MIQSVDPHQFQTFSGHSITQGLLVTKQPQPYLVHLPCSLATLTQPNSLALGVSIYKL